jgi:hypothetical protein
VNVVEILCTNVKNGKMRPVETTLRIEAGRIKEDDGGDKFSYDIS